MNYFYYILMGLFWSASFIGIKITVSYFPPIYSALLRIIIAQLVFFIMFKFVWRASLKAPFATCWRAWVVGIFSIGLPLALLFWGEQSVAPALASIINGTVAAWSLLFNILLFRDYSQATPTKITGLLFGFLGIIIIFWPLLGHAGDTKMLGLLAIIGMALSYGFGAVLNQRLLSGKWHVSLQTNLWHQFAASMVFLFIVALLFEPAPDFSALYRHPQAIIAILYLGICSTAIAWMLFMKLIQAWGAVRAVSVMYVVPVLAILWDYLFYHLIPSHNEFYGIVVILIGIALIQFSKRRKLIP